MINLKTEHEIDLMARAGHALAEVLEEIKRLVPSQHIAASRIKGR